MHISSRGLLAAAIVMSALSVQAFAGERTGGHAASNSEGLRAVGSEMPARTITAFAPAKVDPAVSDRATPTAEEAAQLFTVVGHTRDGKVLRKLPSEDIIRSVTETKP